MHYIVEEKEFINLFSTYLLLRSYGGFRTFTYLIWNNSFFVILEFDYRPENIPGFHQNFTFLQIDFDYLLKSQRFTTLIQINENKEVFNIYGFDHYYHLFVKPLEESRSEKNLVIFHGLQNLNLQLFYTDFMRNYLEVSEGYSILFFKPDSDCFVKQFLKFLPNHIKRDLELTKDKDCEICTAEFLEFLTTFLEFKKVYVPEDKCFYISNVKWVWQKNIFS